MAQDVLQRDRVISMIRPPNAPSIKLAKAMGAVQEGEVEMLGAPALLFVHPRHQ